MNAHSKELVHFFILITLTTALIFGAYWYFSVAALQSRAELENDCQDLIIKTGTDYMPYEGYADIDYKMSQKPDRGEKSFMLSLQFYRENDTGGRDAVEQIYSKPLSRREMSEHNMYFEMAFMKGIKISPEDAMKGVGISRYDYADQFERTRFGMCAMTGDDGTLIGDFSTLRKL